MYYTTTRALEDKKSPKKGTLFVTIITFTKEVGGEAFKKIRFLKLSLDACVTFCGNRLPIIEYIKSWIFIYQMTVYYIHFTGYLFKKIIFSLYFDTNALLKKKNNDFKR